jgi:E3 ubiquitin-protein ligase RNF220
MHFRSNLNLSRQSQLKNRKRKIEDKACPICSKVIMEDLQLHVELCLKKQEQTSDESDDEIDVGESYSWCGQTRIRATTLIEGSLSSTGIGTCVSKLTEDEDTEVNIDGDDETQAYGSTQYSERDVILLNKDDQRLRELVIGDGLPSTSGTRETREENNQNLANNASRSTTPGSEKMDCDTDKLTLSTNSNDSTAAADYSSHQIIESLKARIREYENFIKNKPKCLICLDDFKIPVVSVGCW